MNFISGTPPKTPDKQIQQKSFLDMATNTPEKILLKQRYAGWTVDYSSSTAVLAHGDADQPMQVNLVKAPNTSPVRRRLSHKQELEDAFKRLRQGQTPTRIYVPCNLGDYHRSLIRWQATHIRRLHNAQVLYNIPTDGYHQYISTIENELGVQCPQLHEKLDEFADKVEKELKKHLGDHDVQLRLIRPMKEWNAKTALESHLYPYVRVKDFCTDPSRVIGLEDLKESRLAREAFKKSRVEIPVLGAVLGTPHPFGIKTLRDGQFTIVELA